MRGIWTGVLAGLTLWAGFSGAEPCDPGINTWLVLGPFENTAENAGFDTDLCGEATAAPQEGARAGDFVWQYFDDRLFSRNYDDYQDLFSYYRVKQGLDVTAKAVYAHVYAYSPKEQSALLRAGADREIRVWLNNGLVGERREGLPYRDQAAFPVRLEEGWNRLLLKVANIGAGRLGFYARFAAEENQGPLGLTYSTDGPGGPLCVVTKGLAGLETGVLPAGYREWPYGSVRAMDSAPAMGDLPDFLRKPAIALYASPFFLCAAGGMPPYRWRLRSGLLPEGLRLEEDGTIGGTIAQTAGLGETVFSVEVEDGAGNRAAADLGITVRERPNKWFEESRLTALIHHPESLPEEAFGEFAALMKRQGYALGMVISYNNGDYAYRWPSLFAPENPLGDLVGKYKAALESAGLKFGMYIGNLNGPNHGGDDGALLLVEDAMRRYRPAAFWFDWAGWDGVSLDALYSMIKSYDPETLVVLNGIPTMSNGDWDVINLEGWGSWGDRLWELWPWAVPWPKRAPVETWRLVADPAFEYSMGVEPEWQAYMRLQIALAAEGYVPNIDHSPTLKSALGAHGKLARLLDSPLMRAHQAMADWANPAGLPPLYESYTGVNPGPLPEAAWGYNVVNVTRDAVYLHFLKTPLGKTGKPGGGTLEVGPLTRPVLDAVCMNTGNAVRFTQQEGVMRVNLSDVADDPIDAIVKIRIGAPLPDVPAPAAGPGKAVPPGNLAWRKPARLLNLGGAYALPASAFHFARYGVDGNRATFACGGNEWAWTYQVDLGALTPVNRVVVHFGGGYPTSYRVAVSGDGAGWETIGEGAGHAGGTVEHGCAPRPVRYVRVLSIKPDGPEQEGGQMNIAELEVYGGQ